MGKQVNEHCNRHIEILQLLVVVILLFASMRKLLGMIGFIFGTIFGVMFASKSGSQMREDIAKSKDEEVLPKLGKELMNVGKNFVSAVREATDIPVKKAVKEGTMQAKQVIKKAKKKVSKVKKQVVKKAHEVEKVVKKTISDNLPMTTTHRIRAAAKKEAASTSRRKKSKKTASKKSSKRRKKTGR
jgi:gas vesicle protein